MAPWLSSLNLFPADSFSSGFIFLSPQIPGSMAKLQFSQNLIFLLLLTNLCIVMTVGSTLDPFKCSTLSVKTCNSILYQTSNGLQVGEIASLYSVNVSQIQPFTYKTRTDYLVSASCTCSDANGSTAYFHDSNYAVISGDTAFGITTGKYSGQAWNVPVGLIAGQTIPIYLLCGCLDGGRTVVTYTVQQGDTLFGIAEMFSSDLNEIRNLNPRLMDRPDFIDIGWVVFVPKEIKDLPSSGKAKKHMTTIIVVVALFTALLTAGVVILIVRRRSRARRQTNFENPKKIMSTSTCAKSIAALESQYFPRANQKDGTSYESERPVMYSMEELERATENFDETRKIGEGGYGSVYFGMLVQQEVAIKKMKSTKCREFFAELKVLCKIHHINVVELIGYATSEDHLYLVYEYVQNGSLDDHLHDPLLKGNQPLSWNARAQIAIDTARGIEYIHDHTKARHVHRDIKTSNILLDEGLRAKVADFGLAKLVERFDEEEFIATCLVGTPGYLPPESVCELQMTTKTDVFAFGVVLAELVTGYRALIPDNQQPKKMKSLISIIKRTFQKQDPQSALGTIIDGNLKGSYPMEEVYKMAEISLWCLSDDSMNRPEMREVVVKLSNILSASIEWEASLGGNSQVFSGVLIGR